MEAEAKVSIIIPVYNTAEYLQECVESVLKQTWKNIEVQMVDDGSTDGSVAICKQYAQTNRNIFVCELQHEGVSKARNEGINRSTGEYLFFLDSDDAIDENLLELLVRKAEQHGAGIGISYFKRFGKAVDCNVPQGEVGLIDYIPKENVTEMFGNGKMNVFGAIGGKLIRRDLIDELRFDEKISSGEDTLFVYELVRKKPGVVLTDEAFYYYRKHSANTVGLVSSKKIQDIFNVYRYIYQQEAEAGREIGAYQWYSILTFSLCGLIGSDFSTCEGMLAKKTLKEKIRIVRKDVRYHKIPKIRRAKLFLFLFFSESFGSASRRKPDCCGCGACMDICPRNCISMVMKRDGFLYPEIDEKKCVHCGLCDRVCPVKAVYDVRKKPKFYALQARESSVRQRSTSGGAFRLLAENVIEQKGIVIGAAMVQNKVKHIVVETMEELSALSGSKYVQSDTGGIYTVSKKYLEEGRQVLFSGTPCQAEALRRFLGKPYDNLLLVDLICNGVGSPEIWDKYTGLLQRKHRSKLVDFRFRDKRNADDGHTVAAVFETGERNWSMYADKFCKAYFNGSNFRAKCKECTFCTDRRNTDITIGDFWGVEQTKPEWNDGMGTSLVLVHSAKGKRIMEQCRKQADVIEVTECQARQPRLLFPFVGKKWMGIAKSLYGKMPFILWLKFFGK